MRWGVSPTETTRPGLCLTGTEGNSMATAAETRDYRVPLPRTFFALWVVALLAYGVGDTATTLAIVGSPVHHELNPVVGAAVGRFGVAGVAGLKLLAVAFCAGMAYRWGIGDGDRLFTYGPPALLCVLGILTTVGNLAVLG